MTCAEMIVHLQAFASDAELSICYFNDDRRDQPEYAGVEPPILVDDIPPVEWAKTEWSLQPLEDGGERLINDEASGIVAKADAIARNNIAGSVLIDLVHELGG